MNRPLSVACAAMIACLPAAAQTLGGGGDLMVGDNGEETVAAVGLFGTVHGQGAVAPFVLARGELGIGSYSESSSRYYMDDVGASGTRCRDALTGQFVSRSLCGALNEYWSFEIEAGARIRVGQVVGLAGLGYRLGAGRGVHAAAVVSIFAPLYLRVSGGTDHFMVGMGLGSMVRTER